MPQEYHTLQYDHCRQLRKNGTYTIYLPVGHKWRTEQPLLTSLCLFLLFALPFTILGDALFAIEGIAFLTGTCWVFNSAEKTLKLSNKVEEKINKSAMNSLEND